MENVRVTEIVSNIIFGAKILPFFCKFHVNSYLTTVKTHTRHRILFCNIRNILGKDDCKTPANVKIGKQDKGRE